VTALPMGPVELVVRSWSTQGGTERYVHGLARWLVERDVETTVWCHQVDRPTSDVRVVQMGPGGRGRLGRLLAGAIRVRKVPQDGLRVGFLRASGFDVLRAGGGAHAAAMHRLGKKGVADQVERWMDRGALRTAGVVVANSRLGQAGIIAEAGRTPESTLVVRNGVDLTEFQPCAPEEVVDNRVVFVGHGFSRKGLATALKAMVHLPGLCLDVLGEDRRQPSYASLARSLGVAERVRFLGRVDCPADVVSRSRALVLPTRYDPSANVVLEALACGVPPVTTRHDGASEVVPMPWLVVDDPDDAVAVAHAISRAVREPGLRATCRDAALAWPTERSFREFAAVLAAVEQRSGRRELR